MAATSSIDAMDCLRKQIEEMAPDPLRAALTEMVNLLMAAEIDGVCSAGQRERSQGRENSRNGYRARPWDTRVGTIDLKNCQTPARDVLSRLAARAPPTGREGAHGGGGEAYLLGVSTRVVEDLVQSLGVQKFSMARVSELSKELDGVGVNGDGRREILGLDVVTAEDGAGWLAFLRGLRARGLKGVEFVISGAHPGLKDAIASVPRSCGPSSPSPMRNR